MGFDYSNKKVILRTLSIHISKVIAQMNGSLFIIHRNVIGYPFGQGNRVNKSIFEKILYLVLNAKILIGFHSV